jgi:alkyl hydroperoxide reductase subunit AhpC
MLTKTFIYGNTPFREPEFPLENLQLLECADRSYSVEIPSEFSDFLDTEIREKFEQDNESAIVVKIDHHRSQFDFRENQSEKAKADYCYGSIMRISNFQPEFENYERSKSHKVS